MEEQKKSDCNNCEFKRYCGSDLWLYNCPRFKRKKTATTKPLRKNEFLEHQMKQLWAYKEYA